MEVASELSLLHRIVLLDKDGKKKYDSELRMGKCFTYNMAGILIVLLNDLIATNFYYKVTDGNWRTAPTKNQWDASPSMFRVDSTDEGIQVGTDDTFPTGWKNLVLPGVIPNGSGVGELTQGSMVIGTAAIIDGNVDWDMYRDFTNNSGATITVKEIGIYCQNQSYSMLIARDILDAAVDVLNTDVLRTYYIWRTTP